MALLPNMHLLDLSHRGVLVGMAGKGRASPSQKTESDEDYLTRVAGLEANRLQDMTKMQTYVATLNEMAFRKPDMRARILPVVQAIEARMFEKLKDNALEFIVLSAHPTSSAPGATMDIDVQVADCTDSNSRVPLGRQRARGASGRSRSRRRAADEAGAERESPSRSRRGGGEKRNRRRC